MSFYNEYCYKCMCKDCTGEECQFPDRSCLSCQYTDRKLECENYTLDTTKDVKKPKKEPQDRDDKTANSEGATNKSIVLNMGSKSYKLDLTIHITGTITLIDDKSQEGTA